MCGRIRSVHTPTKNFLLVLAALSLAHCKQTPAVPAAVTVTGAQTGVMQTGPLVLGMQKNGAAPGAPLGMYVANFLIDSTGVHVQGAENGVNTGLGIFIEDQENPAQSFEILQQLAIVLQVNVPDMLNRSADRQQTLDTYLETLNSILTRSKAQLTALKQQQKELLGIQHDKRTVVTSIQHDLNMSLQKEDYTVASQKQTEIVAAKSEQAKAESEVTQINSTINLYTNLHKIADKRMAAISANRQVLIAGLGVVDVPGIDELDILKKGNRTQTDNGGTIFGNP